MQTNSETQEERIVRFRALADEALAKAGRRPLPDAQVTHKDYDLSTAPPAIQGLARAVELLSEEDVKAEALIQWPTDTAAFGPGFPTDIIWTPEEIHRARLKLVGYACGLALGITTLQAEPITDVIKAAMRIGLDLLSRQAAQRRALARGIQKQARADLELQRKRKAQKAARKRQRGK